ADGAPKRDRVRRPPDRVDHRGASPGVTEPIRDDPEDDLADPGHRGGGKEPVGADAAGPGIDAEDLAERLSEWFAGFPFEPGDELADPGAPHGVEFDERAVLVEDDEVDAAERIGYLTVTPTVVGQPFVIVALAFVIWSSDGSWAPRMSGNDAATLA